MDKLMDKLTRTPSNGDIIMCESNVYLKENGAETLIMENVAAITPAGENRFILRGLLGDRKEVSGIIEDINLMGHKIILRPA
jgi:predicted RNA-binding protein